MPLKETTRVSFRTNKSVIYGRNSPERCLKHFGVEWRLQRQQTYASWGGKTANFNLECASYRGSRGGCGSDSTTPRPQLRGGLLGACVLSLARLKMRTCSKMLGLAPARLQGWVWKFDCAELLSGFPPRPSACRMSHSSARTTSGLRFYVCGFNFLTSSVCDCRSLAFCSRYVETSFYVCATVCTFIFHIGP